ncbi:S41 family peptidase [Calycomorphotria hydatis]|uniref:Putative CtpA-like serine protease n=1 Tax=Calycomorphotria hydatis TaxID=2528027 RepID=A0A517TDV2_9PLAN|nr:S41 family peptidase [Calycomorphotria hydatis]QDT66553.1 putative CtpA-like serine protease [Calycomorphotria hydatis]
MFSCRLQAAYLVIAFLCLGFLNGNSTPALAQNTVSQISDASSAIETGFELERSRQWIHAIEHYEDSLEEFPGNKKIEYGLRRSKIHFGIDRRYADASFDANLLTLDSAQAQELYDDVLGQIRSHYVDQVNVTSFVAHGTESLYLALANEKFVRKNLSNVPYDRVRQFRNVLRENYWNKPVASTNSSRGSVQEVAKLARRSIGLSETATTMEYLFGGCNSLDDYSNYLTPDRLNDLYGNIEGEFVGLGIEMKAEPGRGMKLVEVIPDSPAQQGGMRRGDFIVEVDNIDCRNLTTDEAARLLRGRSGSSVQIGLEDLSGNVRHNNFVRRAVHVKSIPVAKIIDPENGVGYIRMTGFQKTSAQELDAALSSLERQGMKALIWDLSGNPGGLLTAAVEVLDRFIDNGVLVSTKGRTFDQNWTYSAHSTGTRRNLEVALIVDEDSASASEIVAGAFRDHQRGMIVGRQTYGKWSVQSILPVRGQTGLRLTTAKFYSPKGHTLGKIGVKPDVVVDKVERQDVAFRGGIADDPANSEEVRTAREALLSHLFAKR